MTTEQVQASLFSVLRDYGFATLVAICAGLVLRYDLLLPLMEERNTFIRGVVSNQEKIAESLDKIAQAMEEQSRILYALQARATAGVSADE
jgi:hypothetical protein